MAYLKTAIMRTKAEELDMILFEQERRGRSDKYWEKISKKELVRAIKILFEIVKEK